MTDVVDIAYPSTLPPPVAAPFTPAPRLRRTDVPGAVTQAGRERDFRGSSDVELLLTDAEAEVLNLWHRYTLRNGGSAWRCSWPTPAGYAEAHTRRFSSPLAWRMEQRGIWRVSAGTEVLGRYAPVRRRVETVFDLPDVWAWMSSLDIGLSHYWPLAFEPSDWTWRTALDQALNTEAPRA